MNYVPVILNTRAHVLCLDTSIMFTFQNLIMILEFLSSKLELIYLFISEYSKTWPNNPAFALFAYKK